MTGLIYKELRANKKGLIACAILPPIIMLLFVGMVLFGSVNEPGWSAKAEMDLLYGRVEGKESNILMLAFYTIAIPFFLTGVLQTMDFRTDETKKWGYFTASHPKGIKGAFYAKYVVIFLMSLITMVSIGYTDQLLCLIDHLVAGTPREEMMSIGSFAMFVVFIQIFLRSIDLPFAFRFGQKRGNSIKAFILLGIMLGFIIYILFGPLPESPEVIANAIYDWSVRLMNGGLNEFFYCSAAAFLWITIIGYYVSYRISCKVFMKGVEQYDK